MKNQREIYEALLAGETLVNIDTQMEVALVDDNLSDVRDSIWETEDFTEFKSWEIHVEKKWYENIPDGGVLCWVKDTNAEKSVIREIDKHNSTDETTYPFINSNTSACWKQAQPLTKSEIQVFMDNAPL